MLMPTLLLLLASVQAPDSSLSALPALPALPTATPLQMTETARIADVLLSPFCPGLTLSSCPTRSADSLRQAIQQKLAAGESREEVLAALVADYGEAILGAPPARGFDQALWFAPGLAMLLGLAGIVWLVRRRRRRLPALSPTLPPLTLSSAEQDRLAEALRDVD
jgi:cytochrome c-type biogenesis protein CcmH